MGKSFWATPIINKKNNQVNISIPRKKIKLFDKCNPKRIKFKIEEVELYDDN